MKLEEAIEIIKEEIDGADVFAEYCHRCERDCTNECVENGCLYELAIGTVLQELEHLQKENEEFRKRFKRYGDVDSVRLTQIKEIEETVPKMYMDKETYENLLKEE